MTHTSGPASRSPCLGKRRPIGQLFANNRFTQDGQSVEVIHATPTRVFLDANEEIAFREAQYLSRPRLHVQVLADLER